MAAGVLKKTSSGGISGFLGGGLGKSTVFGRPAFGAGSSGGSGGGGGISGGGGGGGSGWGAGIPNRSERLQEDAARSGSAALGSLVRQYNTAFQSAKSANEQRYQQLLGIANQDYARTGRINQNMLGFADQTTGQRAADIRSSGAAEEANVLQRLRKLGMSGTTVAPTLRAGVRRETESSLNRLADTMQQTRLGVMGRMADQDQSTKLGIMERRTDAYPEAGVITALTQQLGQLPGASFSGLGKMRLG